MMLAQVYCLICPLRSEARFVFWRIRCTFCRDCDATPHTGLPDSLLFQDRQRGRGSHPLLCGETNYTHSTSPTTARVKLWGNLVTLNSQTLSENQNSFPSWGANKTVHLCKHQETRLAFIYFYGLHIQQLYTFIIPSTKKWKSTFFNNWVQNCPKKDPSFWFCP